MAFYYSYRILLNLPANPDLFQELKSKEERFKELFESVSNNKVEFVDWGTKHFVYSYKRLGENIFIWQLAKEQAFEKPTPGDKQIIEVHDTQTPFIFLIFHIEKQIVLIQNKTSVFQELDVVKSRLERFFDDNLTEGRISTRLKEISDQREFWEQLNEFDMVQNFTFDYAPPNFFKGENEVDRLVKDVHEETNFKKFKIYIENKAQGLTFKLGTFKDHIARLSSGAGTYVVTGLKNGVKAVLESFKSPVKKEIEDIDRETEESLEAKFTDIDDKNKE